VGNDDSGYSSHGSLGGSTVDKESKFIFRVTVFSSKTKILPNCIKKVIYYSQSATV